jgi:hypothetical protein
VKTDSHKSPHLKYPIQIEEIPIKDDSIIEDIINNLSVETITKIIDTFSDDDANRSNLHITDITKFKEESKDND